MLFSKVLSIAALLVATVAAQDEVPILEAPEVEMAIAIKGSAENALPGTFWVELDAQIEDAQAYIIEKLAAVGIPATDITVRTNVKTPLINSISFTVPADESTDEIISAIPTVNTYRVRGIAAALPVDIDMNAIDANAFSSERVHSITGVNQVRQTLGLTGKGIKVAVIDSGVDYLHPALGGGFGPGFKVAYGYDLVGDNYSFANPIITPDADPMDNCSSSSHGTHVAGIVGGFGYGLTGVFNPPSNFSGVAPEATIGAYRVFGCNADFTSEDLVTAAIFRAAADGSDIINLSLGGGPVFADGSDSYAAEVVAKAGHIVVASNGNSQSAGLMTNGSPAVSKGAIGSASYDNPSTAAPTLNFEGRVFPAGFGSANPNVNFNQAYEVVAFDLDAIINNTLTDGLTLPPPAPVDAKGKALLIRWGSGNSVTRCTNAVALGASACIIYSNTGSAPIIPGIPSIPTMATNNVAGAAIVDALRANRTARIFFNIPNTISSFSSPGLDPELNIKPDVGGIGGQVLSTISRFSSGGRVAYGAKSGTSMSAPYTSGALALLLQAKGKVGFEMARTLLMNTARPSNVRLGVLTDSVARQGAGLLNIYNAITTKTLVTPPALSLNDTKYTRQHYTLTISNSDTKPVTYNLTANGAAMATGFVAGDDALQNIAGTRFTADYAEVKFARLNDRVDFLEFTLAPGASRRVNVHFKPPVNAIAGLFPVYSGFLTLSSNGMPVASVPYAGMVGSWRDAPIWSRVSPTFTTRYLGGVWRVASNITSTTGAFASRSFVPLRTAEPFSVVNATRGMTLLPIASTTSRYAKIEVLFAGNATEKAALPGNIRHKTPLGYIVGSPLTDVASPTIFTVGPKAPGVFSQLARNAPSAAQGVEAPTVWQWNGEITTNSTSIEKFIKLPAGRYQVKFSGLKHFGRVGAKGDSNYDVVTSPAFDLVY
ncbi:hypothetical protein HDU67_005558 [Dinochytrium kinnereticum]|nr:hypothetical protein HDU67_005558 [Dinochytrium kinnereticum]